jgi:inosose dehydratase
VDPCDELEKVKDLVRNVHVKDSRGGFEDWYFPAVGDGGAVDFGRVRAILDGVGYQGAYTIEIEGIGGEPEPGLEERQRRIARSVAHLRAQGY